MGESTLLLHLLPYLVSLSELSKRSCFLVRGCSEYYEKIKLHLWQQISNKKEVLIGTDDEDGTESLVIFFAYLSC